MPDGRVDGNAKRGAIARGVGTCALSLGVSSSGRAGVGRGTAGDEPGRWNVGVAVVPSLGAGTGDGGLATICGFGVTPNVAPRAHRPPIGA